MRDPLTRRRALQAIAISPVVLAAGCSDLETAPPLIGEIVGANRNRGHKLRNLGVPTVSNDAWKSADVVIVGSGIAGLTSGWELHRKGFKNFVLLELEDQVGGTSQGGVSLVTSFPWGAHYLPAPTANNRTLVELLDEMGIISSYDAQNNPIFYEENLCRDPSERLFSQGKWSEELIPSERSEQDQVEWIRFRNEIDRWVAWRDDQGRRAFGLPIASCSDAVVVRELDQLSMSDWLKQNNFQSELVRWEVDYACRDDYGTTPESTSAWAGLFYFAARIETPGSSSQPFLTWPEGNAKFVKHLSRNFQNKISTGMMVVSVTTDSESPQLTNVIAFDSKTEQFIGYRAKKVIFAAPQFIAKYLISDYQAQRGDAASKFTYAPWLVANLHLNRRPAENGFPAAWDNVIYDSRGLGYVIATHQSGQDHGPTVLTYYLPLCDRDPKVARSWLEQLTWEASAEIVLSDLERAHPDIRRHVQRLDVMHWGHAMIRPLPGFITSDDRLACQKPFQNIHFANTDLSGVALMEEAFYHGVRAAGEVLTALKEDA